MENTRPSKKQIIEAAFAHVYTDAEELIKDAAREHTIANLGQELEDFLQPSEYLLKNPQKVFHDCFNGLYSQSESDEMADALQEEYRDWQKRSRKDVEKVQKKKLPLTMTNVRLAFENKGPFEKKARKK